MTRCVLIILGIVALAGCSANASYDFDLKCSSENLKTYDGEAEITFGCIGPKFFNVLCVANTVTYVGSDRFCTTHDGKSVRIQMSK